MLQVKHLLFPFVFTLGGQPLSHKTCHASLFLSFPPIRIALQLEVVADRIPGPQHRDRSDDDIP